MSVRTEVHNFSLSEDLMGRNLLGYPGKDERIILKSD
jgi:hypothetical protein